jgi:hypothetical protein
MANYRTNLTLRALEAREVLTTTNLFNPGFYLARNPDVAAAVQQGRVASAEDHFRRAGDAEGRSGNAVFDTQVYLDDNPDVRAAVQAGRVTAFRHFEAFGQFERRNTSRAFRVHDYLDDNPDVRNAVNAGGLTGHEHFVFHGQFEDRLPFRGFDRSSYLDDNPDVRSAVQAGQITAVAHFTNFGRFENRRVASATPITAQPGQTTVFSGVSQNHDDRKFFHFTPPASGTLTVVVQSGNGVFAQAEVEDAATSIDVLETEPNDGINSASGQVIGGRTYLLRMRAPDDFAAQFTVRLTLS